MASSSSFAHAKQPRPYEVFISFRGEDTRNNFVSHLHSALKDRGIRTYFDEDNLQKGQTIGIELVKAIEESSIAIVVLSSNYGSSTWCLNELVKIMECKNKSRLIVFPIFYHVKASDVRKQKNSFFEAFSKHEVNFKDDGEKVKSWRQALTQVANLSGQEIHRQNEALCIKEIGDKILKQVPVKASHFRKSCVGIESRILEIKKMMHSKPEEVLYIGLWGMGGIGKTTMARAIFEDCKDEFEGNCLLQDVKESKNRMENVQKKLLSNVLKTNVEDICDVVLGSSMIQERLQFKKVFIVIDDVDDVEQLNALAGECDWFGTGSRIIITTRDEHLINDHHIEKYYVQTLPEHDALRLFCLHAFKNVNPHEDFKELSHQLLKYAGGLPLALQVLGAHLYRRDTSFWKSTLRRLKDLPDDKIISRLQISFDGLSFFQQDIFLDIACGFRGHPSGMVEQQLQSLELHPKEGIDVLIQKSLIYINMVNNQYCIEMHDLLQEMGWYIVRKRSNGDVTKYSRLWLKKDILEVLSNINVSAEAERIYINFLCIDNDIIKANLGWEALRNISKLRFLKLYGDLFNGNYDVNDSQPFDQVGNKLRWFCWREYRGRSLPKSLRLVNLVHLGMESSRIKETPDFSHMPNLEVLNLCHSKTLVYVHPSLGNHVKIKHINLAYCTDLEEFPKINGMKSLEILDLSHNKLQSVPEIYGELDSLRKLQLWGTFVSGRQTSIEAVSFPALVWLEIIGSGIVKTMDFSHLPYLEKLYLSSCEELVQVHASLGVHKRIKSINLSSCPKLEEFPTIVDMESLEELILSYTRLQSFPEMRGNVNRLIKLELNGAEMRTLPWSIERATSLQILRMVGCEYLVTLPISFLGPQVRKIEISSGSLKCIEENIDDEASSPQRKRPKLLVGSGSKIHFSHCKSLEELPECLLSRLELLFIRECPILTDWICSNLVDLFDKYQHLCHLQLHQRYDEVVPHEILRAFSKWELISDMLRRRKKPFKVCIPRRRIPSWFQYQFSRPSVTVFLPPLDEGYTHKLRGFVISGINAVLKNKVVLSDFDPFYDIYDICYCPGSLHVVVMYIPIDIIRRDIRDWDGQNECTLLELNSRRYVSTEMVETSLRWGLSLVYSAGEVIEVVPHQLKIVTEYGIPDSGHGTFKVKLAGRTNTRELGE